MHYTQWTEEGKRHTVRQALEHVAEHGLSAPHHFYVTFRTDFPGVRVPEALRSEYPEEMTVVMKDAFWGLKVSEDMFSVELLFNGVRHVLRIPYKALVNFIDAGVNFVLQFDWESVEMPPKGNNIILLSDFRKHEPEGV